MRTHTVIRAFGVAHTAKMSFIEIFHPTLGSVFQFCTSIKTRKIPSQVCCCCWWWWCRCCSHINSHNQFRGHRTGSSHSGAEEYPREKTQTNQRWYTHISQPTQFMPPPETYKREIGSQPTMCQVQTGAKISLLAPGKTDHTACHPRKTTTYKLHVVPITTHTHDRRKRNKEKKR